ncbi:cytochrome P450 [Dothidotthia symphoricarpi CBS 119687]|uniref:Cytochrome P450 n=1 Tax=Dothidotthia symphoricarpi CBS 119687 TaxID=1392245 RepID=A0A6A6A1V0_9PLEO|nr:cytochrome P450 [Dothidotthia symphoricarpi CBS 119687]KAF2124927.1 cytochrome P450 [Dothidotthia symphoricarpi CBS 119687]
MALHDLVVEAVSTHPFLFVTTGPLIFLFIRSVYRLYLHPLAHIPGPILPRVTSLWLYYHAYIGDEASAIHRLHLKFGPLVRVSPHEVDISDADAIQPIYVSKGGFPKAPCYANFDIDGHKTIFSTTDHEHRAPRAKAVVPLFSTKSLRDNEQAIWGCVERMVERLGEEAKSRKPVNVLNLARSLAVDAVSTHLFRENYDGVSEKGPTLSVSAFVDTFVAVGRFFYLPTIVFVWLDWAIAKWTTDHETDDSMSLVDSFVGNLVANTTEKSTTYPGRLMAAGLQNDEVKAQCKDLIFAGTDSTGMNLATIMRNLALYPEKYERLKKEVNDNAALGSDALDIQALPYLTAVVKEALRISMANPTRLPHVVPLGGWMFKDTFFPTGAIVGCSGYELHFNADIFPAPHSFQPERWLDATDDMSRYWFAFGAGSRACIARNLATMELHFATERLARSNVLDGARVVQDGDVEILEWFNSKVKGEKIELVWE